MNKENLCRCNNCMGIFIDTNPQVNSPFYGGNIGQFQSLISIEDMRACPNCKTDEFLTDDVENFTIPSNIYLIEQ